MPVLCPASTICKLLKTSLHIDLTRNSSLSAHFYHSPKCNISLPIHRNLEHPRQCPLSNPQAAMCGSHPAFRIIHARPAGLPVQSVDRKWRYAGIRRPASSATRSSEPREAMRQSWQEPLRSIGLHHTITHSVAHRGAPRCHRDQGGAPCSAASREDRGQGRCAGVRGQLREACRSLPACCRYGRP